MSSGNPIRTLVIVEDCLEEDLRQDLSDILKETYAPGETRIPFAIEVSRMPDGTHILTFPLGLDFDHFLWIVNFLRYPFRPSARKSRARGYTEIPAGDPRFPSSLQGEIGAFNSEGDSGAEAFTIHVVSPGGQHWTLDDYPNQSAARLQPGPRAFLPIPDLTQGVTPIALLKL